MSNENRNVPELRFPGFEDEWKNNELGKLLSIISGHSPSYYSEGSEYPLYKVNDLNNNSKFQNYSDLYVKKKHTPLNKKVIIFPKRGAAILLNKVRIINTPGYIDTNLMGLEFNDINDTEFYYYAILREGLYRIADTSTIPQINNKHILPYKIYSPSYIEKNKLGNFFSKLDRQIELEEQKLAKLEEQKKGYMQKIFSKELRFKDENGNNYPEWEDKKLLNVIGIQNGYAFKSNLFSEKGMPIIRITDINKSTVKKGTVYYPESIEINERFKIKQYDILIAMSGATTGKVGKYISEKPSLLNQRIGKFVMKKGTDNNFMFTYLNSLYFKKELSKLLVAGAQPNISSQDIENINLFIPINEEQRKIGEFFNELDGLIEKQSSKIGVLKQRKKGFLQKMFV